MYPPIVARQQLVKDVPAATKNCWRRGFQCGLCHIKGKQAISFSQDFLFQNKESKLKKESFGKFAYCLEHFSSVLSCDS
jgi:hypothetical protein